MAHDVKVGLGIKVGLLRFSVGIEDIEDIYADIDKALMTTIWCVEHIYDILLIHWLSGCFYPVYNNFWRSGSNK